MAHTLLGNTAPIGVEGNAVTEFWTPGDWSLLEAATTIRNAYGSDLSSDPPEWVESSDDTLAALLVDAWTWPDREEEDPVTGDPVFIAAHTCQLGRPDGWVGAGDDWTV